MQPDRSGWWASAPALALGALLVAALAAAPACAQERRPALVVTLRDERGAAVAGARVTVRDVEGRADLAQATTGRDGAASFAELGARQVRVAVAGTLPNGLPLSQPGDDAAGILVLELPATLDLRAELDGAVLPDPATMVTPDYGLAAGAVVDVPTAPLAPTAVPGLAPAAARAPNDAAGDDTPEEQRQRWDLYLAAGALALALAAVLIAQLRRRG